MVVIFGWGRGEVLDRGEVAPFVCPNCHNQVYLHEFRSQKQVSLYFVPIASTGTDVYLACPICHAGRPVPPHQRSSVDAMVAATRMARTGRLAAEAYRSQAERFLSSLGMASPVVLGTRTSAPAAGVTAGTAPPSDLAERLAGLAKLRDAGVLTDEEFSAAKRRILEE
jgi:hypothetical protein